MYYLANEPVSKAVFDVFSTVHKENATLTSKVDRLSARGIEGMQFEIDELNQFKEFVNMMIRRNLTHIISDYEVIMAIDEKLTGKKE